MSSGIKICICTKYFSRSLSWARSPCKEKVVLFKRNHETSPRPVFKREELHLMSSLHYQLLLKYKGLYIRWLKKMKLRFCTPKKCNFQGQKFTSSNIWPWNIGGAPTSPPSSMRRTSRGGRKLRRKHW